MASEARSLTDSFPEPSYERWLAAVGKLASSAADPTTYDRTTIRALYRADELEIADRPPGVAPFMRGAVPASQATAWEIRQAIRHPEPRAANELAREELAGGATSILLQIDEGLALGASAPEGIAVYDVGDLEALLDRVPLETGCVAFDPGWRYGAIAALFVVLWRRRGLPLARLDVPLGADPLGAAARGVPLDMEAALARAVEMMDWCEREGVRSSIFRADGHPYHAGGASAGQELGAALATAIAYLRELDGNGMPIDRSVRRIEFRIAVDADIFTGMAKLRALRRLWHRVCEACGAQDVGGAVIDAITARRMMTSRDVHLNLLRTTAAAFAAAAGGAAAVTVLPFDDALGLPTRLARRLARNIQLILRYETRFDRTLDPVGGSFFVESLTRSIAREAWSVFQLIEGGGGMAAMLRRGSLQDWVAETWAERAVNLRRSVDPIIGVSVFPDLGERRPEPVPFDAAPLMAAVRDKLARAFDTRGVPLEAVIDAAAAGGTPFYHGPLATCTPLPRHRLDEEFEALRTHSDAVLARTGRRPELLMMELGLPAQTSERAGFVRYLFAAGGIDVVESGPVLDVAAAIAAFERSRRPLVVMAGSEESYAELALPVATALAEAGAARLWMANRAQGLTEALTEVGVERYLEAGDDIIAVVDDAYNVLGDPP